MKNTFTTILLATALGQASATFKNAKKFESPAFSTDVCEEQQSKGWDWGGLGIGAFTSYSGFEFSGFLCAGSFGKGNKRDLAARTSGFQSKCITGSASKDIKTSPKISSSVSLKVKKFSIEHLQVSVEFDCDLEFHYSMKDGSSCKQTSACKTGGTTVKNTQCGGAVDVSIVLPSPPKGKSSCDVGIHSVGFKCASTSTAKVPSKATATPTLSVAKPPVAKTTPAQTSTIESSPVLSSSVSSIVNSPSTTASYPVAQSSSALSATTENSPVQSSSVSSGASAPSTTASSAIISSAEASTLIVQTPAVETTSASSTFSGNATSPASVPVIVATPLTFPVINASPSTAVTSNSPVTPSADVPAKPATSTIAEVYITTLMVDITTTICPVTLTQTSAGLVTLITTSTISTKYLTKTATVCQACEASKTASITSTVENSPQQSSSAEVPAIQSVPVPAPATPYVPNAPYPDVLPSCMNTWLTVSGCTSNTDASCYCPSSNYTDLVFECLSARGADESTISTAQSYFQGICASYVPQNPAIITAIVPVVTPGPTASVPYASGNSPVQTPAVPLPVGPLTTLTANITIAVPVTNSAGVTVSGTSIEKTIRITRTVPQVVFITVTATLGSSAAAVPQLVPGTAAPASSYAIPTSSSAFENSPAQVPASVTMTFATVAASGIPVGTGSATAGSPKAVFTGAANKQNVGTGIIGAAAFAVAALVL